MVGTMNLFDAISRAADVTKPGVRDRLPTAAIVFVAFFLIMGGAPGSFRFDEALHSIGGLSVAIGVVLTLALITATILFEPALHLTDSLLRGRFGYSRFAAFGNYMRGRHRRRRQQLYSQHHRVLGMHFDNWRAAVEDASLDSGPDPDPNWRADASPTSRPDPDLEQQLTLLEEGVRAYPRLPALIQATMLGNAIAATEERAGGRYGLVTSIVLPRLVPLMSDAARAELEAAEKDLQFATRMASASILAMIVATLLLLPAFSIQRYFDVGVLVIVPLFGLMAWASYRNAIVAAIKHGEAISVCFDLYRFALYSQMRMPIPKTSGEERHNNLRLRLMMDSGVDDYQYVPQPEGNHPST
jgi:hypothetical protein